MEENKIYYCHDHKKQLSWQRKLNIQNHMRLSKLITTVLKQSICQLRMFCAPLSVYLQWKYQMTTKMAWRVAVSLIKSIKQSKYTLNAVSFGANWDTINGELHKRNNKATVPGCWSTCRRTTRVLLWFSRTPRSFAYSRIPVKHLRE